MNKHTLLKELKKFRSFVTSFYIAEQSMEHLKSIRLNELEVVLDLLPIEGKLLEIGGGTGWQARAIQNMGYDVKAIDISSSNLENNRIWPIIEYDGKTIPFEDNTFDIIFSSNVLEHIPHIYEFQKEIHRVIKQGGIVIHVLPSSSWRFWSNITEVLKTWRLPLVHGEHAGNVFIEIYYFSCWRWSRLFRETCWTIEEKKPIGLFYTGSSIMDSRLSIDMRKKMSLFMGSACNLFILKNKNE